MYQLELKRVKLQIERLQLEWRIEQDRVRVSRGTTHDVSAVERQTDLSMLRQRLPSLRDVDVLNIFLMYEQITEKDDVPREQWAKFLGPQLSVKATRAFLRLSSDGARNYDVAKSEILNYFQLDSKSYLHAFRTARRQDRSIVCVCKS